MKYGLLGFGAFMLGTVCEKVWVHYGWPDTTAWPILLNAALGIGAVAWSERY